MNIHRRLVAVARVLPILVAGLIASNSAIASPPAVETPLSSRLPGVENAHQPYPWLVTGGQPSADALEALAQAGVCDVFDLRGSDEPRGFDEPVVVRSAGLHYLPIPVSPSDFSDAKITAFRHHLIAHGPERPMFIHCASGNRVGAALLPWLVLDRGFTEEAALALAHDVGLRNLELTNRALEYIRTHERRTR